MVASFEKAVRNNEWIVVTGWKPHSMGANFDLKYLDNPQGVYPKDVCAIVSRKGFEVDAPEAAGFFKNFNLEEGQLYDLMAEIKASNEDEGAQKWYEANKEFVDSWFE